MNKTIIICVVCITLLLQPGSMMIKPDAVMYTPEDPNSLIVYCHPNNKLVHTESANPKRPLNTYEGIVQLISEDNPGAAVLVTWTYSKSLVSKLDALIDDNNIEEIIISGWSAGGNLAVRMAAALAKQGRHIKLLFLDCNHTTQLADKYFKTLAKYDTTLYYACHVMGKSKDRVLRKIMAQKIPIVYYKLTIPKNFSGSQHIYCRDSAIKFNLYGYLLGTVDLNKNYKEYHYDYSSKSYKK